MKTVLQNRFPKEQLSILLLHSKLSSKEQQLVFKVPPVGVRKVVLATNIAETSVTIDDVVHVIDSGHYNKRGYDAASDLSSIGADWIPKSSAQQRAGRAVCTRFWA